MRKIIQFVPLLIMIPILMSGCGSFKKIDEQPFKGDSGHEITGSLKRLDRENGDFTAQLNIKEIWYEGIRKKYRGRGSMLGFYKVDIRDFARTNRKSRDISLYDMEDELRISVISKSTDGSVKQMPFEYFILSDDLMDFSITAEAFQNPEEDVFLFVMLDTDNTAENIVRGFEHGSVRTEQAELRSKVELCLTCEANKGV